MQNSTIANALEDLRKKKMHAGKTARKLGKLRKKMEKNKPKKLSTARGKKMQLVNLRLAIELRKKMDAIKQKINKND